MTLLPAERDSGKQGAGHGGFVALTTVILTREPVPFHSLKAGKPQVVLVCASEGR
ncbi:hypothetical protein Hdeb2414_s0296g00859831 [Helianthus debilis subsp. tardiflorus]